LLYPERQCHLARVLGRRAWKQRRKIVEKNRDS
jgi:hypothetical protein